MPLYAENVSKLAVASQLGAENRLRAKSVSRSLSGNVNSSGSEENLGDDRCLYYCFDLFGSLRVKQKFIYLSELNWRNYWRNISILCFKIEDKEAKSGIEHKI